jgi:hypothetical protein
MIVGTVQPSLFDFVAKPRKQPAAPGPGTDNRNAVYDQVRGSHSRSQLQVLELLKQHPEGLTIDEAAQLLGKTPNQISGRFSELSRWRPVPAIVSKGEKRKTSTGYNAVVWHCSTEYQA